MEVRCPKCAKRLRYSDSLRNPLLRCRACGTTFRAAEVNHSEPEPFAAVAAEIPEGTGRVEESAPFVGSEPAQPSEVANQQPQGFAKRGVGTFVIIALVVLAKVGPHLLRDMVRDNPPKPQPPQPVRLHQEHRQAIEKVVREADAAPEERARNPAQFPQKRFFEPIDR